MDCVELETASWLIHFACSIASLKAMCFFARNNWRLILIPQSSNWLFLDAHTIFVFLYFNPRKNDYAMLATKPVLFFSFYVKFEPNKSCMLNWVPLLQHKCPRFCWLLLALAFCVSYIPVCVIVLPSINGDVLWWAGKCKLVNTFRMFYCILWRRCAFLFYRNNWRLFLIPANWLCSLMIIPLHLCFFLIVTKRKMIVMLTSYCCSSVWSEILVHSTKQTLHAEFGGPPSEMVNRISIKQKA